jgi:hypothetical protein
LGQPEIGVRYWLPFGLGFFLDFSLPIDTRENSEYWVAMALSAGAQFSTQLTDELSLGSQFGVFVPFANTESKVARGMDLKFGVELDYAAETATPFIGFDFSFGLTEATWNGDAINGSESPNIFDIKVGASVEFGEDEGADVSVTFEICDKYKDYKNKTFFPVVIGAHIFHRF